MHRLQAASLITAIKTPFSPNGEIDLSHYDALVEQQIAAGVEGIVVAGTTGEGHLLDTDELLVLLDHSIKEFSGRLLIIGNTGSNSTRKAIKITEQGFALGMDAALQINPYYGMTSSAGLIQHFNQVLALGPGIIYNAPGRTGQDISPDIIDALAGHQNFVGIKECAGNQRIAYYEQRGIACWSGNDDESFVGRHQFSSHGVISVTANLLPRRMRQLMDENTPQNNQDLQAIMQWLFCEPNPIAISTALMMSAAIAPVFRLPYHALSLAQRQKGLALLLALEPQDWVGNDLSVMADSDFIYCP
jgi:4-hydroxy-tetrahydrodipicolinate synthase